MIEKISFGPPDNTWEQYGLSQNPVIVNGKETKKKAIIKYGQLVTFTSKRYKLLPNEEAVKVSNTAAKLAGLIPFNKFEGPWIIRMDKTEGAHIIIDKHRVHALYAHPKSYEIGDEEMWVGAAIHNSIDGSMGFKAGIFTFRAACKNVVLTAGMKGWSYHYSAADHGKTVEYLQRKHTKGLATEGLKNILVNLMERTHYIIDTYRLLTERRITDKLIDEILNSNFIPKKILPDYIVQDKAHEIDLTQWTLYNDMTELIWHNAKAGMKTKLLQFRSLHKLIPFEVTD